jgi:hypothetical protein
MGSSKRSSVFEHEDSYNGIHDWQGRQSFEIARAASRAEDARVAERLGLRKRAGV